MKITTSIAAGLFALSVTIGGAATAAQAAPTPTPTPAGPATSAAPTATGTTAPSPTSAPTTQPTNQARTQQAPAEDMMVPGRIYDKWVDRGRVDDKYDALGAPLQWQYCGLVRGGCFQPFERGNIYHLAPATSAWVVRGAVLQRWGAGGWERSDVGYPIGDEWCASGGQSCLQEFERGLIAWYSEQGAYVVKGEIRKNWQVGKWGSGRYGYPSSEENCGLRGGGCFQTFGQGNGAGSIYWSPASGAHGVGGEIGRRWAAQRWETGALGYPTTDEFCQLRDNGCGQHFQGGSIYWSFNTGPQIVSGPIRDAYARDGWEAGRLGYPRGEVRMQGSGAGSYWIQDFQGGWISVRPDGTGVYVGHF